MADKYKDTVGEANGTGKITSFLDGDLDRLKIDNKNFVIRNLRGEYEIGFIDNGGNLIPNATYFATGFIPVEPEQYVIWQPDTTSVVRFLNHYDYNKQPLGSQVSNPLTATPYQIPTDCHYIRVSFYATKEATFMIEDGSINHDYTDTFYHVSSSNWFEKLWSQLGDSLTAQNLWQPWVASGLGLIGTNLGIGGTRIATTGGAGLESFWQDERVDSISQDSDLLTILGGTNDWVNSVALGTLGDDDTDTIYGALEVMYHKLVKRLSGITQVEDVQLTGTSGTLNIKGTGGFDRTVTFNTDLTITASDFVTAYAADYLAKDIVLTSSTDTLIFTASYSFQHPIPITLTGDLSGTGSNDVTLLSPTEIVFITPPYSEVYEFHARAWSNAYENTLGLTINDYSDAIVLFCASKGLKCIDVNKRSGINTETIRAYITEDANLLHPNATGGKIIGEIVINDLIN